MSNRNSTLKTEEEKEIQLCSGSIWCPVVTYRNKEVFIKDDYGNEVRLPANSWNDLIDKAQSGALKKT